MRKTKVAIIVLSTALVTTNAAWLYALLDAAVSYSYLADSYQRAKDTAKQAVALLPVVAKPGASKESIIAAAMRGHSSSESDVFEQGGMTWIGELGLRFDAAGVLIDARPATDPL
jgi:hypothetical protein